MTDKDRPIRMCLNWTYDCRHIPILEDLASFFAHASNSAGDIRGWSGAAIAQK